LPDAEPRMQRVISLASPGVSVFKKITSQSKRLSCNDSVFCYLFL